jgi:polysaccharide chain length determinant protein (PEP-CTERM system associated)
VSTPEIDARINAAQRNIDTLTQRYTDQHPDVVQARRLLRELEEQKSREVAELRKQAAAAAAGSPVVAAPGSLNAGVAQELQRMLATAEMQVSALRGRVADLTQRMAQARAGLRDAPEREAEAAQLNRDYGAIKSTYNDLVSRRQRAVMSGELEVASGVAEFRLIDPPRVTPKPVAPNRLALFPMVLAASVAAGVGLAFAGSQLRPTFGNAAELRAKTGLPLLGVVTALVSERELRRERANLFRWVSASGGLVGLFVAGMIAMVVMNRYGA